ncbi:hypothetical protein BH11CYA1_BH11CYA1_01200 [soil metagenome]
MAIKLKINSFASCLLLLALSLSGSASIAQNIVTDFKSKAIPTLSQTAKLLTSADYHKEPVNLNNPKSHEQLVSTKSFKLAGESYYARTDKLNAPYYRSFATAPKEILLRSSAAKKLQEINQKLAGQDLEVFLFDGFRPVDCQKELWQYFLKQAKVNLASNSNGTISTEAEQIAYASRYCSNPSKYNKNDSSTWPTHCTGGAVDLTLRRKSSGELLYMGSIFDDDSAVSHSDYFEKTSSKSSSQLEAQANRRLLFWLMKTVGFENYHYEWWHFDYGNQMWLMNKKASSPNSDEAFYGPAQ